jgi:Zn ribbon nucleic-acid-binding protein
MNYVKSIAGLHKCPMCDAQKSSMVMVEDAVVQRRYLQCRESGATFVDACQRPFYDFALDQCPSCHQKGITDIILPNGEKIEYCIMCKETFRTVVPTFSIAKITSKKEQFDMEIRPMIEELKGYVRKYEDIYFCEQLQTILNKIVDYVEEI